MKLFSMNLELFSEKKVALIITQHATAVKYEIFCLSKLTKNTVKIEHKFVYILSIDDIKDKEILDKYKEKLEKDLQSVEYDKVAASIGIDVETVFIDEINIPKLSSAQMEKTLHTELKKIYGNYEKKFEMSIISVLAANKKYVKVSIAFLDKGMLQMLYQFVDRYASFTSKVRFLPSVIKQKALSLHLIDPTASTLFINISEKDSRLVITKQFELLGFETIGYGFKDFKKTNRTDKAAAEKEILKAIIRIIAFATEKNIEIELIKINVENNEISNIDSLISEYIANIPVLVGTSENFSAMALSVKQNDVYDYSFNAKVK